MYLIVFSKKALKSLKKIPIHYQIQVKKKSEQLTLNPFNLDLKKLSLNYTTTHRLRIGDYRLFLRIDLVSKTIYIEEIKRRTTQTYR